MKALKIDAYAKINLSLDVLRRRDDGYHELRMIMQQIDLKDIITFKEIDEGIIIESNNPKVPTDSSNLVYKAWKSLSEKYGIKKGVYIKIEKNIPIAAGLAGGSSDAAAVLKGLNEMWKLNLTQEELMDIGVNIGADIPYCIIGGTALAEGIGERLTRLKSFSDKLVLIAKPDIDVSTAYVYKNLDLENIDQHPDTDELIKRLEEDELEFVAKNMVNVLETVTIKEYKVIEKIKEQMISYGAVGSLMSGSGPTVFGIFHSEEEIIRCKEELSKWVNTVYITKTI